MCGRYTYLFTWKQLRRLLDLVSWPEEELTPRYNVAPMQGAPVVRLRTDGDQRGERCGAMLRWGLVPFWADDPSIGSRMINARSETAFEKPAFRKAIAERRCVVPISGFYEWQAVEGERTKRPHYITRPDGEPIMLAGLWERWRDKAAALGSPAGEPLETFTVLTTAPNALMRPLHDRMPAILTPTQCDAWLDPASERPALVSCLGPYGGDDLTAYPVSRKVNSPKNDDSSLIQRGIEGDEPSGLFGKS
ncbi:MAG: SOS response-associated peptidase [Phycisphaeraceae bacterium]|nr:SOS response-associated peptidase [Phycisphaeraceae bacterium]